MIIKGRRNQATDLGLRQPQHPCTLWQPLATKCPRLTPYGQYGSHKTYFIFYLSFTVGSVKIGCIQCNRWRLGLRHLRIDNSASKLSVSESIVRRAAEIIKCGGFRTKVAIARFWHCFKSATATGGCGRWPFAPTCTFLKAILLKWLITYLQHSFVQRVPSYPNAYNAKRTFSVNV